LQLSYWQVAIAALLVILNGAISLLLRLRLEWSLFVASLRMVVQLVLVGFVLEWVFAWSRWYAVLGLSTVMTVIAGLAAVGRTDRCYAGIYTSSIASVWASSWIITAFAMGGVLGGVEPWYRAQHIIPLLGMILGNTLSGISLGLDRLGEELTASREQVEILLSLGATRWEAAQSCVRGAVRIGMIPMINSMMVTGVVSLPGMMTGQLLSGVRPNEAVKHQIVTMFLIASGTALGTVGVVLLSYRQLFDAHHRFRYDRLRKSR
jgi:putative ABC transport system permease protein